MKASNLSEREFRVIVIRMLKCLDNKYTQPNENYKELNEKFINRDKNQEKMKNDILAIKNTTEGFNRGVGERGPNQ